MARFSVYGVLFSFVDDASLLEGIVERAYRGRPFPCVLSLVDHSKLGISENFYAANADDFRS